VTHYLLMVVHPGTQRREDEIEEAMEPFRWGTTYFHPDFYWDYWVIGGRWDGFVPGNTLPIEEWGEGPGTPVHRVLAGGLPICLYGHWEENDDPKSPSWLDHARRSIQKIKERYPGYLVTVVDYHN